MLAQEVKENLKEFVSLGRKKYNIIAGQHKLVRTIPDKQRTIIEDRCGKTLNKLFFYLNLLLCSCHCAKGSY
jgi:hypothetical protein